MSSPDKNSIQPANTQNIEEGIAEMREFQKTANPEAIRVTEKIISALQQSVRQGANGGSSE
jgi:hypothetical protein